MLFTSSLCALLISLFPHSSCLNTHSLILGIFVPCSLVYLKQPNTVLSTHYIIQTTSIDVMKGVCLPHCIVTPSRARVLFQWCLSTHIQDTFWPDWKGATEYLWNEWVNEWFFVKVTLMWKTFLFPSSSYPPRCHLCQHHACVSCHAKSAGQLGDTWEPEAGLSSVDPSQG